MERRSTFPMALSDLEVKSMTRRVGLDGRPLALGFWIDCLCFDFRLSHMGHMPNTLLALSCDIEKTAVSFHYLSLVELLGIDLN
jgi:hypothetical protein